jgi:hypothetical protein
MRSPVKIVGFIDPEGTSFQSSITDRAVVKTRMSTRIGLICRRQ